MVVYKHNVKGAENGCSALATPAGSGHEDTLFIATVLVTISFTTMRSCVASLATALSAGSSLSLWYCKRDQIPGKSKLVELKANVLS